MIRLSLVVSLVLAALLALPSSVSSTQSAPSLVLQVEGKGEIVIALFSREAPKTTDRIAKLVRDGFYNGQRFHRVDRQPKPYLAQVGDPSSRGVDPRTTPLGDGGTGVKVPFEDSGKPHVTGAVGLARDPENMDSGDCQFYITLAPQPFLDGYYCVFGQVVEGMGVVDRLEVGDRIVRAEVR